jgi:hypothetical protein
MTLYKCECGKQEKEISQATIGLRDGKWVCIQAQCECGKYMDSEPEEGMPTLRRTEPSLSTQRDKLWDGAKEKLLGERGINESFD